MKIPILTTLALVAFAGNSILCRMALGTGAIDAVNFASVRLLSGGLVLFLILSIRTRACSFGVGSWKSSLALFLYALPFSIAYTVLETGTGALILFAAVQLTMLLTALRQGETLTALQWVGISLASGGLVYLLLPGLSAPSPSGSVFMIVAGVSWGAYSIFGRGSHNPLSNTAGNFIRTVPFALLSSIIYFRYSSVSPVGIYLAMASGAITSGIGYTIWYAALRELKTTTAAVVQLSVPVIAAAGGALLMSEAISLRLVISSVVILGGVAITLRQS